MISPTFYQLAQKNIMSDWKTMPQRTFAPPVAKPHNAPFAKGKVEGPQSKQEGGVAMKLIKSSPPKSNQKQKINTSITPKCKKDGEMTKNKENYLTDAQYDEIFQSVIQKPLQESMEISGMKGDSVDPNKEQNLGRENLALSPASKDGASGKRSKESSPLRSEKFGKPSQHAKGKEENEKPAADNGGCRENRKGAPKKKVNGNTQQVVINQEEMQEEEEKSDRRGSGWCIAWVQCSSPNCQKWRQLPSDIDPSVLPDDWSCSQNPDLQHNSCSAPEETWSESENEVVYAAYIPGSLVWAKQCGYPWWPGLIEADPDIGEYFLFSSQMDSLPSKYHVTFFGTSVTRAWISVSSLRNFGEANVESGSAKLKNKSDKRSLETALEMAKEAEQMNIQERIKLFGFFSRFNGGALPKSLKDHVHVSCKPPAKRARGQPEGENKNTGKSNKGQEKLPSAVLLTKPDGKVKQKINNTKGFKKSFSVAQHTSAQTKHLKPCSDSSTAPTALSSCPNNQEDGGKVRTSPLAKSKGTVDLKESSEAIMASDKEEEETFGSQDMSVFAVEKDDCPEDFSLVLFEE